MYKHLKTLKFQDLDYANWWSKLSRKDRRFNVSN